MPLRFAAGRPSLRALALACCIVALPWVRVAGQRDPHVRAGQTVRVRLADGRQFEAPLVAVDSNPLVLRFGEPHGSVPIGATDSLWLRRTAARNGALVGGIVVGALGGAFWVEMCKAAGDGTCGTWGAVAGLTAVTAGLGALLGAGIGSLIPRWQRVDPPQVTLALGIGDRELRAAARIRF